MLFSMAPLAKKVVISAPSKTAPMFVMGVNQVILNPFFPMTKAQLYQQYHPKVVTIHANRMILIVKP